MPGLGSHGRVGVVKASQILYVMWKVFTRTHDWFCEQVLAVKTKEAVPGDVGQSHQSSSLHRIHARTVYISGQVSDVLEGVAGRTYAGKP